MQAGKKRPFPSGPKQVSDENGLILLPDICLFFSYFFPEDLKYRSHAPIRAASPRQEDRDSPLPAKKIRLPFAI